MLLRRLASTAPVAMVVALCATSSSTPLVVPTIDVGGRPVATMGLITVDDALRRAHVVVPAGHVLTAMTRRPIAGDHQPGQILVDGHPAAGDSVVGPGSVVTVVPGVDVTEPLQVLRVAVPPTAAAVASLYVGGLPGSARVVRGALSGETVSRRVVVPPGRSHLVTTGAVALTFDDGPDPSWTPRVLAMLTAAHVHATFCLVGRQVQKHPELVRAIVRGGHTVCNHTWSHDELLSTRPAARIVAEMQRTQAAIRAASGVTPLLFRAPGGRWTPQLEAVARAQGLRPLKWNVDPRDWAQPGWVHVVGVVVATLRPGGIVLLHDGGGDRIQTLVALKWMLIQLPRRHYSFQLPRP
jgi:peptidoglycan/xylan/chitin deacetylase (PgdA/CDA1 family)